MHYKNETLFLLALRHNQAIINKNCKVQHKVNISLKHITFKSNRKHVSHQLKTTNLVIHTHSL